MSNAGGMMRSLRYQIDIGQTISIENSLVSGTSGRKASFSSYSKPPTPKRGDSIFRQSQQLLAEVTENNIKQAQTLLQSESNLTEIKDQNNQNLLHLAASNNNSFLFELILRKQLKYDSKRQFEVSQFSTWVNEPDIDGFTPGHLAAHRGNVAILKLFLEKGGDIHAKSQKGLTVLHVAAQNNQSQMLAYLKEYCNFPINVLDNKGGNALHQACYFGCSDAVSILLSWKLEVNQQDTDGLTPLHLAIVEGHLPIVKKLLHRGASTSLRDRTNQNAYELAIKFNQNQILDYLKENRKTLKQLCCQMQYKQIKRSRWYLVFFLFLFFLGIAITYLFLFPFIQLFYIIIIGLSLQFLTFLSYLLVACSDPGHLKQFTNQIQATLLRIFASTAAFCGLNALSIASSVSDAFQFMTIIAHGLTAASDRKIIATLSSFYYFFA